VNQMVNFGGDRFQESPWSGWRTNKSGVVVLSIRDTYMSCNALGGAYFVRTSAFISSF
jgi:hypothetical protein